MQLLYDMVKIALQLLVEIMKNRLFVIRISLSDILFTLEKTHILIQKHYVSGEYSTHDTCAGLQSTHIDLVQE